MFIYGGEVDDDDEEENSTESLLFPEIFDVPTKESKYVQLKNYSPLIHHSAIAVGDCGKPFEVNLRRL